MIEEKKTYDIKSFVLRSGRMTDMQKKSYELLKKVHAIPYDPKFILNSRIIFQNDNPLVVEIGIGMGLATIQIAKEYSNTNYLGIEVHKPGIGRVLNEIEIHKLSNLKLIEHDAVEVISNMIADNSIHSFNIFFPDPWPKKKHHKRRIIQDKFVAILASKLKQHGEIYFVTDIAEYAEWTLDVFSRCDLLENKYSTYAEKQEWRPLTKFENKGLLAGRPPCEIVFRKK